MIAARLRTTTLLTGLLLAGTALPASALAAPTLTVAGDGEQPAAMPAGGTVTIRNMRPTVTVAFPNAGEELFTVDLVDAAGRPALNGYDTTGTCFRQAGGVRAALYYHGNQTYQAIVKEYAPGDTSCATPTATTTYGLTINASVEIVPPSGPFVLPGIFSPTRRPYSLVVKNNPGSFFNEVLFARDGVVGPDGALLPPYQRAFANAQMAGDPTSTTSFHLDRAGRWKFVARAGGLGTYSPASREKDPGDTWSPWSASDLIVKAPFEFRSRNFPNFSDFRGPTYTLKLTMTFPGATGKASIALARGAKGGSFKSLGTAPISSTGTITKRFRATFKGAYRLRVSYKGSEFGVAGTKILRGRF